jgi:hypothetical protein
MRQWLALSLLLFLYGAMASRGGLAYTSRIAAQAPSQKSVERERERAYARQQFTNNFRDLQLLSQGLLREHDARRLTAQRLAKDAKAINKCAKNLRTLMALGALAQAAEVDKQIDAPEEYDQSIRRLAKLIYDFAHSPHHQNSKVFDAAEAARVQTKLLTIINLSKAIESKAKGYTFGAIAGQ